jgi:hypothetical protein
MKQTRKRTGELDVEATEVRQRDARCERRQRACVKRANPVNFEKKNLTAGMSGTTLLSVENTPSRFTHR